MKVNICLQCKNTFSNRRGTVQKYCSHLCYGESLRSKVPWNKGKKTGFVPRSAFKKGDKPWNAGTKVEKTKEQRASYRRKHYLENREKYIFQARVRKEQIKVANLDPTADMKKISTFYLLAEKLTNDTGVKYCVDHIKPLSKGGKHHQNNLQVITVAENVIKSAKYPFSVREAHFPDQIITHT